MADVTQTDDADHRLLLFMTGSLRTFSFSM
jgi:hypothetical protein